MARRTRKKGGEGATGNRLATVGGWPEKSKSTKKTSTGGEMGTPQNIQRRYKPHASHEKHARGKEGEPREPTTLIRLEPPPPAPLVQQPPSLPAPHPLSATPAHSYVLTSAWHMFLPSPHTLPVTFLPPRLRGSARRRASTHQRSGYSQVAQVGRQICRRLPPLVSDARRGTRPEEGAYGHGRARAGRQVEGRLAV